MEKNTQRILCRKHIFKSINQTNRNILTTFNQAFMCKISKKNDVFFKKNNFFVISNQNYEKLRYIINEKKNKIIPNFLHHIKYHKLLYHKIYKSNITQRCFKVIKENACFITGPLKNKNKLGYFKRAYKIKYYNKCNVGHYFYRIISKILLKFM